MQAGEIPFISYQNIVIILTHHPLVVVSLLIELICLMVIIYGEFMLLLTGFREIGLPEFSWRRMFRQTKETLSLLNFWIVNFIIRLLLTYYSILRILSFELPCWRKIQVPQFIVDYLTRNTWLIGGLTLFYLLMTMIGIRF